MFDRLKRRALIRLARRHPLRHIQVDGEPYLDRYYICGPNTRFFPYSIEPVRPDLPFTLFLHHFRRGDQDRDLHNHPWAWAVSLMLAGGYYEEYFDEEDNLRVREIKPGQLNAFHADHFHRVDLRERDGWSLIAVGPKIQSWGFKNRETKQFVHWREYLGEKVPDDPALQFAEGE